MHYGAGLHAGERNGISALGPSSLLQRTVDARAGVSANSACISALMDCLHMSQLASLDQFDNWLLGS